MNTITCWIEPFVESQLLPLEKFKTGISWHNISPLSAINLPLPKNYCFKLMIPYVKQTIVWEIHFNPLFPELGPEMIINGDEFAESKDSCSLISDLPNLYNWSFAEHLSLTKILSEFLHFYKQKQVKLLEKKSDRLYSEYLSLQKNLDANSLEVLVINSSKQTEVQFLLKLHQDLQNVSAQQNSKRNNEVFLFINYFGPSFNRVIPELHLSPYLTTFFDDTESLHIPHLSESQNIIDYVNEIQQILKNKINSLSQNMEERKKFIASLMVLQHESIIEYDVTTYRRISLLLEHLEQHFILNFNLPLCFPREQFILSMHSTHHLTEPGKTFCKVIKNFPYSPRWEPKKMIGKVLEYVINKELKSLS